MTRVKYIRVPKTPLIVIKNPILCNNKNVNVVINEETLVYKIYEMTGVLVEGQGNNLTDCKKRIKRDLKVLGANFKDEIRNVGKTEKL